MAEKIIDIGNQVACDICCTDYTDSDVSGGFLMVSFAYCPECARKQMPAIERLGESHLITSRCPEGVSFAAWILTLRKGNNRIIIRSL